MKCENVTLAYQDHTIIEQLDMEISSGEFIFLIGESGAGKTTFLRLLSGNFQPSRWTVLDKEGNSIYGYGASQMRDYRRQCGIIFQDYQLLERKTVYENVAYAMEVSNYSDAYISERVPEVLIRVGLREKSDRFPSQLSGWELQRVAIARALVHNPKYIFADEPTGNLDPKNAQIIMDILTDLNKEGKTIIFATHDMDLVWEYEHRTLIFEYGEIRELLQKS